MIADQAEQLNAARSWMPKNFHGPPLKIPEYSAKFGVGSQNSAVAMSPQIEANAWVGKAPTGSSIWSRSSQTHPTEATAPPTAPISSASHGRQTAHIAKKYFETVKGDILIEKQIDLINLSLKGY